MPKRIDWEEEAAKPTAVHREPSGERPHPSGPARARARGDRRARRDEGERALRCGAAIFRRGPVGAVREAAGAAREAAHSRSRLTRARVPSERLYLGVRGAAWSARAETNGQDADPAAENGAEAAGRVG
jgi:hypothetical protein